MGLGSYTLGDNSEDFCFVDCSVDSYDLELDSSLTVDIRIKLIDVSGTNVCTITDSAAKNIDGSASLVLSTKYDCVHLVFSTDNDEWYIV